MLIAGSIEWNVRQLDHIIEGILEPHWTGFPKDGSLVTLSIYCDRLIYQTRLADGWDWNVNQG